MLDAKQELLHLVIWLLVAGSFAADLMFLGLGIPAWALYLLPLFLCLFTWRPRLPLLVGMTASLLSVIGYFVHPEPTLAEILRIARINRAFGFVALTTIGFVIAQFTIKKVEAAQQDWLTTGANRLSERLQGEQRLDDLGRNLLVFLAEYVAAQVGAAYCRAPSGDFVRCGGLGLDAEDASAEVFKEGEGLVGQAAADKRTILIGDVPDGYLRIHSGVGAATPRAILLVPTLADEAVNGVIELGFLTMPGQAIRNLLAEIAPRVGTVFRSAAFRREQAALLTASQHQAEELQAQQEELEAANDTLRRSQKKLDEQTRGLAEARLQEARLRKRFQALDQASLVLSRQLAGAEEEFTGGILQAITDQARVVMEAEFAALGVGSDPRQPFEPWVFSGLDPALFATIGRHPRPGSLLGKTIRNGSPVRLRNLRDHPEFGGFPPGHPLMSSFLAVPISFGSRDLGNLYVANKQTAEEFTDDDQRTLELFVERAAVVMEIDRLNHQVRSIAAELERASSYKSEFLANMSHELRTPLNSSLILAKLLFDNKQGNLSPEQVNYAQSIYSAGNDLLALINDILDLSKIEAGRIELNIATIEIDRLMDDLKRRFNPLIAGKELEFLVSIEPECPTTVETDLHRLHQILTNLLSNAVKFTDRGTIRLCVTGGGTGHLSFTVEDTGIGIPADKHQVIFDAFRQADGTPNRKFGGTGLGLSICRELSRLLGGEVRLRSTPGKGSCFTLVLPDRPGSMSPPLRSASVHSEPVSSKPMAVSAAPTDLVRTIVADDRDAISDPRKVVLVVEDDPAFAQIVRDLARELGFQCVVAGDGTDGMHLAKKYHPVAIVLDVGLPDGSGLAVLEVLKRDPATRHVPIHVVSVHDHRKIAQEMGAIGYVLKPVTRDELASAFRLLEKRISSTTKHILVVEDDAVQRDAVTRLLAAGDVCIATAQTVDEALSLLRQKTYDCVILDLMLPGGSGFDLLDRMSADATCPFPPVIVYTARTLSPEEERKLRRHSKSIIIKGARSPERLLEEVTLFLHQVESDLPPEKQRMLKVARDRESIFDGRRVLLVEDDVRNVFALTSMLEPKGLTVDVARNGKEALARLSEQSGVDLVLMDIMMPEMDGLTATREIRKTEGNGNGSLPIIALTAKAMPDDRHECLAAGANDYIAKPIDPDKLLSLLRVWMPPRREA